MVEKFIKITFFSVAVNVTTNNSIMITEQWLMDTLPLPSHKVLSKPLTGTTPLIMGVTISNRYVTCAAVTNMVVLFFLPNFYNM